MFYRMMLCAFLLLPVSLFAAAKIWWDEAKGERYVETDSIPNHTPGRFPNAGNPNRIKAQDLKFKMPTMPQLSGQTVSADRYVFGVALDGVVFDPGTAEFYQRDRRSGWRYEAFGPKSPDLGLDDYNAHVQPDGTYHYHAMPKALVQDDPNGNQLGWAADGYPIFSPYNLNGKEVLRSSYQLKQGTRPSGPGGIYDGTFTQDYEYVEGSGDLDECNGIKGQTILFPYTDYYYVVTEEFPFVPRCFKGVPDQSFAKTGRGMPPHMHGGPGGHSHRPPPRRY